ncbi:MAG TPA: 4Fe-4S dicluster domain-containing protein [Desulfotomaculum sp.]|nr:4Fe-4S dicluster domain-containing protein [Desulfotomaculum sp.]
MGLSFAPAKCIGCHLCELACSASKHGVFNPYRARLQISSFYRPTGMVIEGRFCDYCLLCVESCPTGAISNGRGYLTVDESSCTGCGSCAEACPRQVIRVNGVAEICDLCGGEPQCVIWCPHGALNLEVVARERLSGQNAES